MISKIVGAVCAFIVLTVALIVVFGSWGTIDPGHRGVVVNMGKVTGEVKSEGFYTKMPWFTSIVEMDVRTQKEQVQTQAASKDMQTVSATVALNLSLIPEKAPFVYQTIGRDYLDKIVAPYMQESVKAVIAKYTAEELITKREDVRHNIGELLGSKLSPLGIRTEAMNIINFDFSRSFNEAIEAKVTAEQSALAAKNKLAQVQYEADQRIAKAKGEAEAIAIQSKAIQEQGGAAYIQLKAIEQWNGVLPSYMTSGAAVPFVPVPATQPAIQLIR